MVDPPAADGSVGFVEVYDQGIDEERVAPAGVPLFVAFVVDDLEGAHREVRTAGIEASDIVWAAEAFDNPSLESFGWFFLHAPDGNVDVIESESEWDAVWGITKPDCCPLRLCRRRRADHLFPHQRFR